MDTVPNGNRRRFAITLALVLAILGSVALFAVIQNCTPYVAAVKGEFYTPVVNPSEAAIDRAIIEVGLLRLALWPAIVFVALEAGATYAISTLVRFEGRFAATRRLAVGAGSALVSAVLVAAMWSALQGVISK